MHVHVACAGSVERREGVARAVDEANNLAGYCGEGGKGDLG